MYFYKLYAYAVAEIDFFWEEKRKKMEHMYPVSIFKMLKEIKVKKLIKISLASLFELKHRFY